MKNDGGPAFPVEREMDERGNSGCVRSFMFPGMSLRDYFAAKAMQGELACQSPELGEYSTGASVAGLAQVSYEIADAMLAEREKEQDPVLFKDDPSKG